MRRFITVRDTDVSGVSGTGVVTEGIEFTDGTVVIRWLGELKSTAVYPDIDTFIKIHGHDGATKVQWVDYDMSGVAYGEMIKKMEGYRTSVLKAFGLAHYLPRPDESVTRSKEEFLGMPGGFPYFTQKTDGD